MKNTKFTRDEALAFHMEPVPGKWEVNATVPMATQRDFHLHILPVLQCLVRKFRKTLSSPMTTQTKEI